MTARTHRPAAAPPPARSRAVIWIAVAAILLLAIAAAAFFVIDRKGARDGRSSRGGGPLAEAGLVTKVESLYNDIYVYQEPDGNYMLSFGAKRLRYVESEVNPKDELDLPVYYTQSMTAGLAYAGALDDAMIIGLGGGRTAWYHHKSVPGLEMTAVELDPEVARIADTYFNVRPEPNFDIDIVDGRVFLAAHRQALRHHHGRRLSRAVRSLPPAHDRVLQAGRRASEAGRRRGAERRADDDALRQRGRHHQDRLRARRLLRGSRQHRHRRL